MMNYVNYSYWGMHSLWWIVWVFLLIWIFAAPYNIPGQRFKKETPLEILNRRFAKGEIDKEEFQRIKDLIIG